MSKKSIAEILAEEEAKSAKQSKNDDGIITKDASPNTMMMFPWDGLNPHDKKLTENMSSFSVNQFTKAVFKYLREETQVSDRKRINRIMNETAIEVAKKIEAGEMDLK